MKNKKEVPQIGDIRYTEYGPVGVYAIAGDYVMIAHPKCIPYACSLRRWYELSTVPIDTYDLFKDVA